MGSHAWWPGASPYASISRDRDSTAIRRKGVLTTIHFTFQISKVRSLVMGTSSPYYDRPQCTMIVVETWLDRHDRHCWGSHHGNYYTCSKLPWWNRQQWQWLEQRHRWNALFEDRSGNELSWDRGIKWYVSQNGIFFSNVVIRIFSHH